MDIRLVVQEFTCPRVYLSDNSATSKTTFNARNTSNAKIPHVTGQLGSEPSLVGRIGWGPRVAYLGMQYGGRGAVGVDRVECGGGGWAPSPE